MDDSSKKCLDSLKERVRTIEENDPVLRELKEKINKLTLEIKNIINGSENTSISILLDQQSEAIEKLINHVSSVTSRK